MTGLMGLLDKSADVDWTEDEFKALVDEVHAAGLELGVIESVNVHEEIKLGLPIRMPAFNGVKVIVYNFMPVFDWLRTDLGYGVLRRNHQDLYRCSRKGPRRAGCHPPCPRGLAALPA